MTETQAPDSLPFFPGKRSCPFAAPDLDAQAQRDDGLFPVRIWNGLKVWLVGRYADVKAALDDPRVSADIRRPNYPHTGPGTLETTGGLFVRLDGEAHMSRRRWLMPDFTLQAAQALEPEITRLVDERIDAILAMPQPVDFQKEFALAIPTAAICIVMGVPTSQSERFQKAADVIVDQHATVEQMQEAVTAISEGMNAVVKQKMASARTPDLLSRMVHDCVIPGKLSAEELVRIAWVLIVAGHETTGNMISLGILSFLEHPDQRDAMLASGDVRRAVEEQLRFWSIVQLDPRRIATEDIKLGDHTVRAGEGMIFSLPAANRDPRWFGETGDPEKLDVTRETRHHVAFGYGPHTCIGQNLARAELRIAFARLFARMPTLHLAVPVSELKFKYDRHEYGVYELPLAW